MRTLRLILASYLLIYLALFDFTKEHHLYIEPLLEHYFEHHEKEHDFHHHHDDFIFHEASHTDSGAKMAGPGLAYTELDDDDHVADHVHAMVAGPPVFSIDFDYKPAIILTKHQASECWIASESHTEFSPRAPPLFIG